MPSFRNNDNRRANNCRSIVTAFSIAVCVRIWISSSIAMAEMDQQYGHWVRTYGVVVGSEDAFAFLYDNHNHNDYVDGEGINIINGTVIDNNSTNIDNIDNETTTTSSTMPPDHVPYYCALVNYTTTSNDLITSRSHYPSDCSMSQEAIPIGLSFELRYNPDNPKEFMKQIFFSDEIMSLGLMIAVGFALTVVLFYFACRVQPEVIHDQHSRQPFDGFGGLSDEELGGQAQESPEERKERILSKMIFQTVLEDLSNTTAEQMRALEQESATTEATHQEEEEEEEELQQSKANAEEEDNTKAQEVMGETTGAENSNSNDEIRKIGEEEEEKVDQKNSDDTSTTNGPSSDENDANTHDEEIHPGNGLLQMFSSWRRLESEPAECCICLDKYEHGETICCASANDSECKHVFHKDCVMDWLMKNHNQCPLCRTDLLK